MKLVDYRFDGREDRVYGTCDWCMYTVPDVEVNPRLVFADEVGAFEVALENPDLPEDTIAVPQFGEFGAWLAQQPGSKVAGLRGEDSWNVLFDLVSEWLYGA